MESIIHRGGIERLEEIHAMFFEEFIEFKNKLQ